MAVITLHIDDDALRLTVKALLEAEGHSIAGSQGTAELAVCDRAPHAVGLAKAVPTLLLAKAQDVPAAVQAMQRGVYGYVFLPLAAGELGIMVHRALGGAPVKIDEAPKANGHTLEEREAEHILEVLRQCRHNQAEAARRLGIGRNTLWRKMKRIRGAEAPVAKGA